ncbi:hypothetical protein [Burkholderia gladioli]|uniref:hypothetical protein n=1 Tax=Burkholderia gladioli TaxID=28095 RepID=UPI00163F4685|nr:hypothetical protein [Burkholderia gladioli]
MEKIINTDACDFVVISRRSGNAVATFMLPADAAAYIAWREAKDGSHSGGYEIVNADNTPLICEPRRPETMVTVAAGKRYLCLAA